MRNISAKHSIIHLLAVKFNIYARDYRLNGAPQTFFLCEAAPPIKNIYQT